MPVIIGESFSPQDFAFPPAAHLKNGTKVLLTTVIVVA
jgi:hypothetical protein